MAIEKPVITKKIVRPVAAEIESAIESKEPVAESKTKVYPLTELLAYEKKYNAAKKAEQAEEQEVAAQAVAALRAKKAAAKV